MTTTAAAASSSSPIPPSIVPPPPNPPHPRFTLELEFVLSLSNPYYLSHLAITYPHLLNQPPPNLHPGLSDPRSGSESDSSKFAAYLAYLYDYWRKPEYARFLSHPGVTLRNLELLQQEQFRRDIIRPDIIGKLLTAGGGSVSSIITTHEEDDADQDGQAVKEGQIGKGAKITQAASGQQQQQLGDETVVKEERKPQDGVEGKAMNVGAR